MSLTHDDVTKILNIIDQLGDRDVRIEFGDLKIHISPQGAPPRAPDPVAPPKAQAAAPARPAGPEPAAPKPAAQQPPAAGDEPVPAGMVAIRAPMVGTFYRAPAPGAKPFVEVGQKVGADDTLFLLEVMKLFNSVKAGTAGSVARILVENGAQVAHNQLLMLIEPA